MKLKTEKHPQIKIEILKSINGTLPEIIKHEGAVEAYEIKNDSIELTKQSISDVKKKFPDLIVTLNCKALD